MKTAPWDHTYKVTADFALLARLRDVVRRIRKGFPPMMTDRDSLETMRVVFAAEKSADCGQTASLDSVL
jgi:hypothetical protein